MSNPVTNISDRFKKSQLEKVVDHTKKYYVEYCLASIFVSGMIVGRKTVSLKSFEKSPELLDLVQASMNHGVDLHLTKIYKSGQVALNLPMDEFQLFLGAAVNAGKISQDLAKDMTEFGEAMIDAAQNGIVIAGS